MKNKTAKKAFAMMIMIAVCITLFSFGTVAVSDAIRGSITLTTLDKDSKEAVSGTTFRVYHIASAYIKDDNISFVYTEEFKNNGMDMGNFSDAYLPVHLAVYAQIMSVAYTEKSTGSTGKVVFDNLPCGAYLVVPVGIDEDYFNPTPFIVAVPMKNEIQNKWVYNIDATPKIESDKENTNEKTYISVKKYWQGTKKTPDSITVSLIKDGVISDSVVLSAANNWYHKWENLDKNHSWSVVETEVPEGYTVSYVTSQMTVIITNTDGKYEEETTTSPDDTTVPESTTKPEELIDTGQLNWPIPIFSIAGLLLFSLGWAMFNFGNKGEETE